MLTGYTSSSEPGFMVEVHVSPNADPEINRIAREEATEPYEIIRGLTYVAFEASKQGMDRCFGVPEGLQAGSPNIFFVGFENNSLGAVLVANLDTVFALITTKDERVYFESQVDAGVDAVDLGWIRLSLQSYNGWPAGGTSTYVQ